MNSTCQVDTEHIHILCIGDFLKETGVYEDITEFKQLKIFMEEQLEDYNIEPGVIAMDLVLFQDAVEHGIVIKLFKMLWHFSSLYTLHLMTDLHAC